MSHGSRQRDRRGLARTPGRVAFIVALSAVGGIEQPSVVEFHWAAGALASLSFLILLWQWAVAWRFPLHKPDPGAAAGDAAPSVSILKPVHGADPEFERCLESWFRQEHAGPLEVLVGVHRADDPAVAVARKVMDRHPSVKARLVVCPERPGLNDKACTLARLEEMAGHNVVVASDADVLAQPGLLRAVIAPLATPGVGLVHCLYRNPGRARGAQALESLALNVDFWSQVLQSRSIGPQDFALGAVMALRRADLLAVGGFRALVNHLADDFQLGQKIHGRGLGIHLTTVVADCIEREAGPVAVWRHQVRWARTIRSCRPVPFFLSILSNGTLWPAMAWASAWTSHATAWPWLALLLGRLLIARSLLCRMCPEEAPGAAIAAIWIKDLAAAAVWAAAFLGNVVEWRGRRFKVRRDGTLAPA